MTLTTVYRKMCYKKGTKQIKWHNNTGLCYFTAATVVNYLKYIHGTYCNLRVWTGKTRPR